VASTIAEDLSLTVIGWYHSHPHITVLPSHVDVKTQGQYQGLGNFLGLIFSVFDKGRLEMCAFQSRKRKSDWERVEIPVVVSNKLNYSNSLQSNKRLLESLIAMQLVLINEDRETFENVLKINRKSYLDISRSLSVYQVFMLSYIFQLSIWICVEKGAGMHIFIIMEPLTMLFHVSN
jgi:hypothetical protein